MSLICLAEVCWARNRSTIMVHRTHPGLCFLGSRQQMPVIPLHFLARKLTAMSMDYKPSLKVPLQPLSHLSSSQCTLNVSQNKLMIKRMNTSCISDTSVWSFLTSFVSNQANHHLTGLASMSPPLWSLPWLLQGNSSVPQHWVPMSLLETAVQCHVCLSETLLSQFHPSIHLLNNYWSPVAGTMLSSAVHTTYNIIACFMNFSSVEWWQEIICSCIFTMYRALWLAFYIHLSFNLHNIWWEH